MTDARDWCHDFDHTDPSYAEQIWEVTRELRNNCSIAEGRVFGGFKVLSKAQDVRFAYLNPDLFLSGNGATLPSVTPPFPAIPVETDGEAHRAYRMLINRWLSPKAVRALEPQLRALVDEHIDRFATRGRCDFVAEFSYPLPAAVISLVMGLPRTEWRIVKELFETVLTAMQAGDLEANKQAWATLIGYLGHQVEQRRDNPRDDMLTELAHAEVMGRPLTFEETMGIAFTLVTAGQDTTSNTIGMMVRHLAQTDELRQRLIDEPSLIPDAIEEMLRWFGPVQTTSRTLAEDTEISGCPLKAGERVALLLGSANRDADVFENPDVYDLDRPDKRRHIAFGTGDHGCAGRHLARLELRIVFERLLARIPDFEMDGEPCVSFPGGMVYGLSSLPLRFSPQERKPVYRAGTDVAAMGPYSVRTLVAGADCEDAVSIIEYTAGEAAEPEQAHGQTREAVAVVMADGAATFEVDGVPFALRPGQSLFIPRGLRFRRVTVEEAPARYTMTFTPGGFDRFFGEAAELVARRRAEGLSMEQIMPEIAALQLSYGMLID